MTHIRRAYASDAKAITELRLSAFQQAHEFCLADPGSLSWSAHDERNIVLAAWSSQAQALSTTRGEVYQTYAAAEQAMECSWKGSDELFPCLLLGKGATRQGYGRQGLHSALRYHFLDAAKRSPLRSVVGIIYEDAPRTRLMRRIGYELAVPDRVWYTDLHPYRRTLVAVLHQAVFASACKQLRSELADTLAAFPLLQKDLWLSLSALCVPGHDPVAADTPNACVSPSC